MTGRPRSRHALGAALALLVGAAPAAAQASGTSSQGPTSSVTTQAISPLVARSAVAIQPGKIALARTPWRANSTAMPLITEIMPAFVAV